MPKQKRIFYEAGYRFPGTTFVVLENLPSKDNRSMVLCQCDCGKVKDCAVKSLKSGNTRSCGCGKVYPKIVYEVGYRFPGTRLTVIDNLPQRNGKSWLRLQCDCGNTTKMSAANAKRGLVKSCGCRRREMFYEHGMVHHPFYRVWKGMKERCEDPEHTGYKHYGARGIYVCDEWHDDVVAAYAWALEYGWRKGLHIDRIDNDGPYAPWNCRIVTCKENARNTRRNVFLTINGITAPISEHAERSGINQGTIWGRLKRKWSHDDLLNPPRPMLPRGHNA